MNNTRDQMDLTDMYRAFDPKSAENALFSTIHGTFSRRDQILNYKTSLNKYKKIEVISNIFSKYNSETRNQLQE